jgi:hypothetical protein
MSTPQQRLAELLTHRTIELDLELSLERRIRAYAQGLNARINDTDPYDPTDDTDLAQLITLLCEAALDSDERPGDTDRGATQS